MGIDIDASVPEVLTDPAEQEALVRRAEADPHRPRFHFVSPAGWINDPNGVGQRDGVYHLFYQYNPHAPVHHRIHWGHATSRDLVHWTDEPVALVPGEDGADVDGCWSGAMVDDGGVPTLVYSGHREGELQAACLATSGPDLQAWTKEPGNPVLTAPEGLDLVAMRDHCVWRENGVWRQVMGSGLRGEGGTALLFESPDLREWTFVGPLVVGDPSGRTLGGRPGTPDWTAEVWECPDLFRLAPDGTSTAPGEPAAPGGTDVLVFSAWADDVTLHTLCLTGEYAGDTFTPAALFRVDLGEFGYYAPQSFVDAAGRRVMHGWLPEERSRDARIDAGWAGAMALPRVVTVEDGVPVFAPVPEVEALRGERTAVVSEARALGPGEALAGPDGDQLDLEVDLALEPGRSVQLVLRASADGRERTVVEIGRSTDPGEGWLRLDRSAASLDETVETRPRGGTIRVGDDGRVAVRAVVDHSVLEVFANGQPLSARVYPTLGGLGTALVAGDAGAVVERFEGWQMADIWGAEPRSLWP